MATHTGMEATRNGGQADADRNSPDHFPVDHGPHPASRKPRRARRAGALERELASYNSAADLDDLHAILDRYSDTETADIRRILAAQRSR